MATLTLELDVLAGNAVEPPEAPEYDLQQLKTRRLTWDRVVKATHIPNCAYQQSCVLNLYVKDGVVLREEQAANYPPPNDPELPDLNPKGCNKGVCFAQRMYDPTRIKYPMKRVGERGEGKWRRIGWDEALTEVADVMIDTLVADGPEAIVQPGGTRVANNTSEGTGGAALFSALGAAHPNVTADSGDDFQGAAITMGKIIIGDSGQNWFYSDIILIWGGNPNYTHITNCHYIAEARYHGAKVITIAPDYNPSSMHADLWVPVNIGTDAALALSMCQVILKENLYKRDFVREQTDLPLLVVESTGKLLREKDLKRDGRDDVFYFWDRAAGRVAEAPRKSLALDGFDPALEGTYQVETLQGTVRATPVMALLRRHLDEQYTPEQASRVTGVSVRLIEQLAREFAAARGVVNVCTMNWGKCYHGGLIQRATILAWALCGHMGHKGASYNAFPMLGLDTAIGGLEKRGDQIILSAAGADPRFASWREDGYTDEMILYEYVRESFARGDVLPTSWMYYLHSDLLELSKKFNSWDPYLKRPLGEYVQEALDKQWQYPAPANGKEPRVMFVQGGNFLKRARGTSTLLDSFLPKLRLMVTVDWRWNSTALYSDIVLPVSTWYERTSTGVGSYPQMPFAHVINRATEPLYESKGDWGLMVLLARAIERRASERGITGYVDGNGKERRFAGLEDKVTFGGLYTEDDEEGVARDLFLNSTNVEKMDWEEFKERGFAAYTGVGTGLRSIGNACEIVPGEPLVPLTWHVQKKQPYPTLTRRMQFFLDHELFEELGEVLPVHKDPPKAGGDYPLQVTGGHARWSVHSDWSDDSLILQLQRGEPIMFMNAEDARARGIADGDVVEALNDVGAHQIQAAVSPAVRPGQVVIYHQWENYQFKGWEHFKNVQASPMNPIELAGGYYHIRPITTANYPGFSDRETRVEVRRVER